MKEILQRTIVLGATFDLKGGKVATLTLVRPAKITAAGSVAFPENSLRVTGSLDAIQTQAEHWLTLQEKYKADFIAKIRKRNETASQLRSPTKSNKEE